MLTSTVSPVKPQLNSKNKSLPRLPSSSLLEGKTQAAVVRVLVVLAVLIQILEPRIRVGYRLPATERMPQGRIRRLLNTTPDQTTADHRVTAQT